MSRCPGRGLLLKLQKDQYQDMTTEERNIMNRVVDRWEAHMHAPVCQGYSQISRSLNRYDAMHYSWIMEMEATNNLFVHVFKLDNWAFPDKEWIKK